MTAADPHGDEPRRYVVEVSDTADQESDSIFLWINRNGSPEQAERWYRGLYAAFQSLSLFPYRYEALPNRPEVRRMLYGRYRVLYRVIEPQSPEELPVVRILRIVHGARETL